MKKILMIYVALLVQCFAQTVIVTEIAGGDPDALGSYSRQINGDYKKGPYVFSWDPVLDEWSLKRGGIHMAVSNTPGDGTPAGAVWEDYTVVLLGDPGVVPTPGATLDDPGAIAGTPNGPAIFVGTFAQELTEGQKSTALENLSLSTSALGSSGFKVENNTLFVVFGDSNFSMQYSPTGPDQDFGTRWQEHLANSQISLPVQVGTTPGGMGFTIISPAVGGATVNVDGGLPA